MTNENTHIAGPENGRPFFFWIVILAGLLLAGTGIFTLSMVGKYHRLDRLGFTLAARKSGVEVLTVDETGPAAGRLQIGDRIVSVNGDPRFSRITQFFWRSWDEEGGVLRLRVERGGMEREVEVSNLRYEASGETREIRLRRNIAYFPRYLACLIVAVLLGLFKPGDRHARLGSLAFIAITHQAAGYPLLPLWQLLTPMEQALATLLLFVQGAIWFGPLAYHASYQFISGLPSRRLWTAIQWALYGACSALYFNRLLIMISSLSPAAIEIRHRYYGIERVFSMIDNWYWMACLTAISAVLIRNNIIVRLPDQRRRLRLILYGSLVAMLPQTAIGLMTRLAVLAGQEAFVNSLFLDVLRMIVNLLMLLVPISWGYAILNRQVYDVNVVVRRSVQYLLARNALRFFLALPVLGVLFVVISKSDRSLRELAGYFFIERPVFMILILVAGLGLLNRRRLREWIDRRFFREAYQQDRILRELSEEVRKLDSMSEMSRLVSRKVDDALHPEHIYLFYREEDKRNLSLGYSSGGRSGEMHIPEEYELLRIMENHGRALEFPPPPRIKIPQEEFDWLSGMGTSLIVPMNGRELRLAGLLLLGPKKSEDPYNGSDRELLDTLANQIAIVYENIRLKDRVIREKKIQHEVLSRIEDRNIVLLKECPACGRCYDSTEQLCAKDRSELKLTLPVERTIEKRYRLDRVLGRGGMGAVFRARDLRLDRDVAVKVLGGSLFGNNDALRRFQREAQASARLNHPNITLVYDYGLLSTEGAFIVMELLEGRTLGQELRDKIAIEPRQAADWFDQILSAMEAAHAAGVIHRDLKPDNIFIADENGPGGAVIKILDFGLAKISRDGEGPGDSNRLTTPGTVLGTFEYMPPEQWNGGSVDERSDIFSLGVILISALTGRLPFTGRTYQELMSSVMNATVRLSGNSEQVRRLDTILQKCLAKNRRDRYPSVTELRRDLIPALRECPPLLKDDAAGLQIDSAATRIIQDTE